jgi:hypothetical protein
LIVHPSRLFPRNPTLACAHEQAIISDNNGFGRYPDRLQ